MRALLSMAWLAMIAVPAIADRPVTEAEQAKLLPAIAAEGCSGGKLEWDDEDRAFEVEDATCGDGRKYELKFDAEFKLTRKKLDD